MKAFTYKDYIECIHKLRLNAIFQIAEEGEKYSITENQGKNKVIKKILENKEEIEKIINNYLDINEKVKKEELKKYNSKYINNKYKSNERLLIYRQEKKEVFFLIECLENIEYTISYKILNYCIDIIYEWSKNKKFNSKLIYPKVVPIIIYMGKEKWHIQVNKKKNRIGTNVLENYKIDVQLNVIETRKLSREFLINQNSLFR